MRDWQAKLDRPENGKAVLECPLFLYGTSDNVDGAFKAEMSKWECGNVHFTCPADFDCDQNAIVGYHRKDDVTVEKCKERECAHDECCEKNAEPCTQHVCAGDSEQREDAADLFCPRRPCDNAYCCHPVCGDLKCADDAHPIDADSKKQHSRRCGAGIAVTKDTGVDDDADDDADDDNDDDDDAGIIGMVCAAEACCAPNPVCIAAVCDAETQTLGDDKAAFKCKGRECTADECCVDNQ
jgi:hypothetical protein